MPSAHDILKAASGVVVVDWPSSDVPDTLARAGYDVFVKGGPGPTDYNVRKHHDDKIVVEPLGRRPERVDLIYVHRPLEELSGIVTLARQLGATAIWHQSGLKARNVKDPRGVWQAEGPAREARRQVEEAGLTYVDDVYIADAVRSLHGG